jgi:glycine/D-amino acid oxidase-like deaminating enzyme
LRRDVVVIGGGISGALSSYYLARAGFRTVLIDRRDVGYGSTAASTGLLQYEIDTPLVDLAAKIGKDRAVAAYRASMESLMEFEPLVAELGDSCGLVARPSLYLASEEKDVETLRAECDARQSMGINVEFLSAGALRDRCGISRPAALRSRRAYEVDPFRLTLRLIRAAVDAGLEAFTGTEISRLSWHNDHVVLHTSTGNRVIAKHVVFATGYETVLELPVDICCLSSTYALATRPITSFSGWPERSLIWEAARPYVYMRTTENGRAIIGGADEKIVDPSRRDKLLAGKTQYLLQRFSELFPGIPVDAACSWAGTFAQTKDGLPYIGTLPQFPLCYFALGYGGNGITFSLLAAEILRDTLLGKESERTHLFGFGR